MMPPVSTAPVEPAETNAAASGSSFKRVMPTTREESRLERMACVGTSSLVISSVQCLTSTYFHARTVVRGLCKFGADARLVPREEDGKMFPFPKRQERPLDDLRRGVVSAHRVYDDLYHIHLLVLSPERRKSYKMIISFLSEKDKQNAPLVWSRRAFSREKIFLGKSRAAAGGFTAAPPRRNSRDRRAEAPSL